MLKGLNPHVALLLFYLPLALLTGAESFTSRRLPVYEAAAKHRSAWTCFLNRGYDEGGCPEQDLNLGPYCRRPLMPGTVDLVSRATGVAWPYAFSAVRLITILAAYVLFHHYLGLWFRDETALLGVVFLAASLPLTFSTNAWEILSDFPELIVFTLGIWCIHEQRAAGLAGVVAIGTLNRETTVLLIPMALGAALLHGANRYRALLAALASSAAWACVSMFLWTWIAPSIPLYSLAGRLHLVRQNIEGLGKILDNANAYNAYLLPLYLFGAFWYLPILVQQKLPPALRAGLGLAPVLLVIVLLFGALNEPRQLIPLYPVLVPASLLALLPPQGPETAPT